MYSNSTSGCILNVETAMNVEMTTFFERTLGHIKTRIKIENKIFLLFTQKNSLLFYTIFTLLYKITLFYTLV